MNSTIPSFQSSVSLQLADSKLFKMKQLVSAIQDYIKTKREETAITINMHLQSLSYTLDLSIFDPHNNIVSQFFVCLYELMNKMEPRSCFAWNCVDVLTNACRNPSARHALIHTYQFIPSLSRLLGDQLSVDKRITLLRLMQDLTCGIKISWQIPHLPQLMVTLTQWIESSNEEVVSLCLAILVNLCYKNLPAIYTLMGNVNVRNILEICSNIQRKSVEIHTCKLLIILDFMNGDIPKTILEKVVRVTFDSICEAYKTRDPILLRQIVEFILDVGKHNSLDFLIKDEVNQTQLKMLLSCTTDNEHAMDSGDSASDSRDPECISLVFEFLNFLVESDLGADTTTYPAIISLALKWIQTDMVSSQALAILKSVSVKVEPANNKILEPLVNGLPIFMMVLNRGPGNSHVYVERNKNISGVLQLLKAMVQVAEIRQKIVKDLTEEMLFQVFEPLIAEPVTGGFRPPDPDAGSIDNINLYVHGVALLNELTKHDIKWLSLQSKLLKHKQIHMILAQSLFESSVDVKNIILELFTNPDFPRAMISDAMSTIQPLVTSDTPKTNSVTSLDTLNFPVISVTQLKRIDDVLSKLEHTFSNKQENSMLTSDVIELYEYKLAAMGNAERAAMSSAEAASERCTHLQHRNAQLTTELNRLHQSLFHVQQCFAQTSSMKNKLDETVDALKSQIETDAGKLKVFKNESERHKQELEETMEKYNEIVKQYEKLSETHAQLEEQHAKVKQVVLKLEDNCSRVEKISQKREETIKKCNFTITSLTETNSNLEERLTETGNVLKQKINDLEEAMNELELKKQILNQITKYAQQ